MARMTPEARRESIVAATLAVMHRQGIAATTVRDVAAALGTSSGLIHHYVASMDELITEAFELAATEDLERAAAAVSGGTDPIDRL
ncbi:MAG: TetR family transcriptional regulator, partial [Actinobacteria bacterium]|nr:TetR family transcriptional regulator [Actinomycetota bacterium]